MSFTSTGGGGQDTERSRFSYAHMDHEMILDKSKNKTDEKSLWFRWE